MQGPLGAMKAAASIEYQRSPHERPDVRRIECQETGPGGGEDGRVGSPQRRVGIGTNAGHAVKKLRPLRRGHRVAGSHLGAGVVEQPDEVHGARFPQVVCLGFERQPEDGHPACRSRIWFFNRTGG